jgi:ferritin
MSYVNDRGGTVCLSDIKGPQSTWDSPLAALESAYKHEGHISSCINELASVALKEGDQTTQTFLNWFINEQVEEEALVDNVVQQLRYVKDSPAALYMMDRDIAAQRASESTTAT